MPRVSDMIESKYLRKENIDGDLIVTVDTLRQENVAQEDQPPEMKWACYFLEFKKPLILNSTNIHALEVACGSGDTDDWKGKEVIIYVDPNVTWQGKVTGGIRIRASKPAAAPRRAGSGVEDLKEDIPF